MSAGFVFRLFQDKFRIYRMKNVIKEQGFQDVVRNMDIGGVAQRVAHAVLVCGQKQCKCADQEGITKGAVSQTVSREWAAYREANIPVGFVRTPAVIIPEQKAFIVSMWAKHTAKK